MGHAQSGLLKDFNSKFPTIVPALFVCEFRVLPPLLGVNKFSLYEFRKSLISLWN